MVGNKTGRLRAHDMRSPLRSLSIPLLTMSLVFGVPRHVLFTSTEPGREDNCYGTASTAPNASEQAPREITPDQYLTLPAVEEVDPDPEDGAAGSSGYEISP